MQNSYVNDNYSNQDYAGFWARLAAYLIDMVIVGAGLLIIRLIMLGVMWIFDGTILGGNILFHYTLKDIVLYIFKISYFVLFTYYTGTTFGKKLLNLRVVPENREEKLSFIDILYRETVGRFLSGLILWIGYIMIGLDKEKRGLHDILCDTRVVYEKKIKVYREMNSHTVNQSTSQALPQSLQQTGYRLVRPEQIQNQPVVNTTVQEPMIEKNLIGNTPVTDTSDEEQEKES